MGGGTWSWGWEADFPSMEKSLLPENIHTPVGLKQTSLVLVSAEAQPLFPSNSLCSERKSVSPTSSLSSLAWVTARVWPAAGAGLTGNSRAL